MIAPEHTAELTHGSARLEQEHPRVVVVDLDHTLIETDTLHEQAVRLIFKQPRLVPGFARALLRGKAAVKAYCAIHIVLDPAALRACREVLAFLEEEKARGSYLVLCSAADRRVAEAVAAHFGIFDAVVATDSAINLKGPAKAELLAGRFPEGFIYAGDHPADLAVWARSIGIVLVGVSNRTAQRARRLGRPILAEFRLRSERKPAWKVWPRALRVHHWSKNVLMFVPLVLAHEWFNPDMVLRTLIGFAMLLAVTSSSYLVNNLADIEADRAHATKRNRPIASGALPISHAMIFPFLVVPLALLCGFLLSPGFGGALAAYLVIAVGYSFRLKQIPLLDTFLIGALFTTRLIMGASLLSQTLPVWLLTFSMFFFFSLATAKRHAEIMRARGRGGDSLAARGYRPDDWPLTLTLGVGASLGSLIIIILYMVDEAFRTVGYARPEFLWAVALLLSVWLGRVWLLTHRGEMHDDPVEFALRDRPSQGIAVLIGICFLIAL